MVLNELDLCYYECKYVRSLKCNADIPTWKYECDSKNKDQWFQTLNLGFFQKIYYFQSDMWVFSPPCKVCWSVSWFIPPCTFVYRYQSPDVEVYWLYLQCNQQSDSFCFKWNIYPLPKNIFLLPSRGIQMILLSWSFTVTMRFTFKILSEMS